MRRLLVLLVAACAVAAGAFGTAASGAGTPKPAAGPWKVVDLFDITSGGKFTVTRTGRVRGVRVTPGGGGDTACGTEPVVVKGTFRLRKATRGGVTSWIVGRSTPSTSDGVTPVAATITRGGETLRGKVKLVFRYDNRRRASGEVSYEGCSMEFDARKG